MPEPTDQAVDVLSLDPRDYKRPITVTLDVELIESLDARRGAASRSDYVEQVLFAAMQRPLPHLPDGWTPETAALETYERMLRHAERARSAGARS
ncbi:MAG: hypothetical protein H0U06_05470 [Solirubrobacterales bacterium]|jgi:hypothetical protein|nr:hypothetical protein [Solirubrobacterales bacterium]MDQ3240507.1 hypothetical protein [Actinomycetota bacterium]